MSWYTDLRDLSKAHEYKLYVSLPLRYPGGDTRDVEQILRELEIDLIDEENFDQVYQQVKEKMNEKYGRLPGVML